MKVIFLDFDGVIVTVHDRYTAGDEFCIALLNEITDRTGAKIVVSSMWRLGETVDGLAAQLRGWGVTGEVIDKTPQLIGQERGHEIQKWLDAHPEVEGFVILDDDTDMAHLRPKLVKCHPRHGLDEEQVEPAINKLNNEIWLVKTKWGRDWKYKPEEKNLAHRIAERYSDSPPMLVKDN